MTDDRGELKKVESEIEDLKSDEIYKMLLKR